MSDWFADAAKDATKTEAAKRAAAQAGVTARLRQEAAAQRERVEAEKRRLAAQSQKSRSEIAGAAGEFAAVAAGAIPPFSPAPRPGHTGGGYASGGRIPPRPSAPKPMDPETALGVIETAVIKSPDPYIAAGEWITKITNALSAIARQYADKD
jgi:hypothetical protein